MRSIVVPQPEGRKLRFYQRFYLLPLKLPTVLLVAQTFFVRYECQNKVGVLLFFFCFSDGWRFSRFFVLKAKGKT
jgi:hypothetical protein